MISLQADYPVPFPHAIAAVDASGEVIWSQGELERIFPLASVTKLLTAFGTMKVIEGGVIDLGDPVGRRSESDVPYTVANLLSHSSGLDAEGNGTNFRDAPERRRIYSNQGFEVLAKFVQDSVRLPLSDWMEGLVFEPLGLSSTSIPRLPSRGGIGNAMDLTLLVEEFLNPHVLKQQSVDVMTSPAFPGLSGILPGYGRQKDNLWGLGVEIKGNKTPHWTPTVSSAQTYGHFGVSGSHLWVDPTRQIGAVFLGAEPFGEWHKENWPILGDQINAAAG